MCEKTASGTVSAPADFEIQTGIAECQRSGVFMNGTSGAVTVTSNGVRYGVAPGQAVTVPVGRGVRVTATGDGVVVWTVTSAALGAQVAQAPQIGESGTGARVLLFPPSERPLGVLLGSGSYSKLVFIGAEAAEEQAS